MATHTCTKCGFTSNDLRGDFYWRTNRGPSSWCRNCMKQYSRDRSATVSRTVRIVPQVLLRLIDLDIAAIETEMTLPEMLVELELLRQALLSLQQDATTPPNPQDEPTETRAPPLSNGPES